MTTTSRGAVTPARVAVVAVALVALTLGVGLTRVPARAGARHPLVRLGRLHFDPAVSRDGGPLGPPGNLVYNGGPVAVGPLVTYAIFWQPPGYPVAPGYDDLVVRFLRDVGGSHAYGVTSQYFDTVGNARSFIRDASTFGGSWVDRSPYPSGALLDTDIQAEVAKAQAVERWPGGLDHEFFVFTGSGVVTCAENSLPLYCSGLPVGYCAYHGWTGDNTPYANMAYPDQRLTGNGCDTPSSPNHNQAADSEISIIEHELLETVTDPLGSAWYASDGSENGDLCRTSYGPTGADGSDVHINGHPYIVQATWSNRVHGCAL